MSPVLLAKFLTLVSTLLNYRLSASDIYLSQITPNACVFLHVTRHVEDTKSTMSFIDLARLLLLLVLRLLQVLLLPEEALPAPWEVAALLHHRPWPLPLAIRGLATR